MRHEPKDEFTIGDPALKLAAWRSQAFWGTTVWFHEALLDKKLKLKHFYILAALTDREAKIVAGVDIDPMTSSRLTDQIRKQFANEYEGELEVGTRMAEKEKKFLDEEGLIYFDSAATQGKKLGWRVTDKALTMINDISDGLGNLATTQAKELQDLIPERGVVMTEEDGFYNRIRSFFKKAKLAIAIPAIVLASMVATADVAEAGPRGFADETLTSPMMLL